VGAGLGVQARALRGWVRVFHEWEAASREALSILREEGLREEELEQARRLLAVYDQSYWLVPLVALAVLGWQAAGA